MKTRDTTTIGRALPVARLVARRIALGAATLLVVSLVVFFVTQALPGDVARAILGPNATDAQLEALRTELGLDQPVLVQYLDWLAGMLRLDFGTSLASGTPVAELLAARAQNSLTVVGIALLIAIPLAYLLGTIAARRPGGTVDHVVSGGAQFVLSMPEFVVGIALIAALSTNLLRILPPTSILDPRQPAWAQPQLIALPVITMVVIALPHLVESVKTLVRDELGSEHVRWARLTGIAESRILIARALPHSAPPSLPVVVATIGYLVGGTVAVETVFSFPGIGSALLNAVASRDVVVVQAITMTVTAILVAAFIVADVVGVLLTPRLRGRLR